MAQVTFEDDNLTVEAEPGANLKDVAEDSGAMIPFGCEQGICGTCVMQVIEGHPDHRDMCLSDDDKGLKKMFTPCCSRSQSARLVLDLNQ